MAIVGGGDIMLPPGFDPGHGVPSPASTPIVIPPGVTVDPAAVAAITYTHPIVLFIGGKARIGAENIIFGPYINGGVGVWANSFGFTVPIGSRLSPTGSRTLYEIAFDSKVVWTLAGGFVGSAFTFRFYEGTFTQGVDPLETANFPGFEIAYRPQMVIFFEGVDLSPFGGKIPFVGAVIGDTTGGADPDNGINLGTAFENFGRSIFVGYSAGDFQITALDDTAPAILCGEMPAIMELLPAAARFYRWDIVRGGVLRVIDHGLVTAPDVVFTPDDIIKADIPLRFDRAAADSVPRALELVTPDPDYDYVLVPSLSQRSLTVSVATTADKETVTLPIVMDAYTRQALVAFAHYSSEHERLSCSFTVGPRHLWVEPGDLFSFSGIGAAFPDDIFHVIETNTGANYTKQITGRLLLRTGEIATDGYRLVAFLHWQNVAVPYGIAFTPFYTEAELDALAAADQMLPVPTFGPRIDLHTGTYSTNGTYVPGDTDTQVFSGDFLGTARPTGFPNSRGYTQMQTYDVNYQNSFPNQVPFSHPRFDYRGQPIVAIPHRGNPKGSLIASDALGTVYVKLYTGDPATLGVTKYDLHGAVLWRIVPQPETVNFDSLTGLLALTFLNNLPGGGADAGTAYYDMDGNLVSTAEISDALSVQDCSRKGQFYAFVDSIDVDYWDGIQGFDAAGALLWTITGDAVATGYEFDVVTAFGEDYIFVTMHKNIPDVHTGGSSFSQTDTFGMNVGYRIYNAHTGALVSETLTADDSDYTSYEMVPGAPPTQYHVHNKTSYGRSLGLVRSQYWPTGAAGPAAPIVDDPPTITSADTVDVDDGDTLAHTLTANEPVTWAVTGGADMGAVECIGSLLRWLSDGTQSVGSPADADTDNVYEIEITATSLATGMQATQNIQVTVVEPGSWVDAVAETGVTGNSSISRPRNIRQLLTVAPGSNGTKVRITFRLGTFSGDMTVDSCYVGFGATSGDPCDFEATPTPVTFGGMAAFVLSSAGLDHVSDEIVFAIDDTKPLLITYYLNGAFGELSAITPGSGGTFFDQGGANETGTVDVGSYGGGQTSIRTIAKVESFQPS